MLHIRLLGNFQITSHNAPVAGLTRPQLKIVLAYLALHQQKMPAKKELAKLFWEPTLDGQWANNLRTLLFHLREELPELKACIHFGRTLRWKTDAPYWLDVTAFEAALTRAAAVTDPAQQQAALVEALALYTGDLWPQCKEEWIFPLRERLRNQYITALEQLITLLEEQRAYGDALVTAQRLLQANPLREESYRRVMQIQAALGDLAGIERTFAECRQQLQRKLQIEPSRPTRELYSRLTQATALAAPVAVPFVERQGQWAQVQARWQAAQAGQPHCLLLTGAPGIGKSRLLTEFVAAVERQGAPVALAECQPFTLTLAYRPVRDWLATPFLRRRIASLPPARRADLAYLLPELADNEAAQLSAPAPLANWQRQRLYETLTHLFLAPGEPLLLALDNAQWCDQETLDWLHYLLCATPAARLLIIGAFSRLELRPHDPVARLQPRLQQSHLVSQVTLSPLSENGVAALGQALCGQPLDAALVRALYQVTEGNPRYTLAALPTLPLGVADAALTERIAVSLLTSADVQATVPLYLAPLSTVAQTVMGLAALLGRTFDYELLAAAALIDQEALLLALDELLAQGIMADVDGGGYTFCHALLQQAALATLSSAKRLLWQKRITHARQQLAQGGE
jgi:DNA-binding SARP family transcriptional activator